MRPRQTGQDVFKTRDLYNVVISPGDGNLVHWSHKCPTNKSYTFAFMISPPKAQKMTDCSVRSRLPVCGSAGIL